MLLDPMSTMRLHMHSWFHHVYFLSLFLSLSRSLSRSLSLSLSLSHSFGFRSRSLRPHILTWFKLQLCFICSENALPVAIDPVPTVCETWNLKGAASFSTQPFTYREPGQTVGQNYGLAMSILRRKCHRSMENFVFELMSFSLLLAHHIISHSNTDDTGHF